MGIGVSTGARAFALPGLVWAIASLAAADPAAATASFEGQIRPFLVQRCHVCHNALLRNADLDLQRFSTSEAILKEPDVWDKVVQRLRTRVMPPPELPQPSAEEVHAVTGWIEALFDEAERAAPSDPGRVTARRLNRTEYNNTLRDLLAVDLRPADDFPQDDTGYGFDNIGDVLSVSPILLEKYVIAAERVARAAVFGRDAPKPSMVKYQPPLAKIEPCSDVKIDYDTTGLSLPNSIHAIHRFPMDAEYLFRVVLTGSRPPGSAPIEIGLFIDDKQQGIVTLDPAVGATFDPFRQDLSGRIRELRVRVPAGDHRVALSILRLYEGLPAAYEGPNPSRLPVPPPPPFEPREGMPPEKVAEFRKRYEARLLEMVPANEARVRHVEITGPFAARVGPSLASLKKVFVCGHLKGKHNSGCASKIVTEVARRAYRRPVTAAEVDPLLKLVGDARAQGDSFEEQVALALQAMLVSPDFLFRIEKGGRGSPGDAGQALAPHELASRLSYFIWSTMPDDELLSLADRGLLADPEILSAQVSRMLADERASALVESFGGQWLQFRALERVAPDRERFPLFEDGLRLSMRRETEMFFESIVREDRSILDLLDAPYSFLNERLARHYGIDGVSGPEFRRVDLTGTARGGVLTQASVLTVSSYATRTSPVLRGKWILENFLNAPPPDPPAGTPRLDEATVGASVSLRQQLEAHRTNATCAACHVKMDPLGFALENYDAVGAWRDKDGKWAIDASGTLPDGQSFQGPQDLKSVLKADQAAFAECVTGKLLTYALGRGLERYDRRTVKDIAARIAPRDYRFGALVLEIVRSLPFQRRRGEPERT